MKRFTFEVKTSGLTKLLEKADELAKELSETMQEIENYKLDCQVIKSGAPNEEEIGKEIAERLKLRIDELLEQ